MCSSRARSSRDARCCTDASGWSTRSLSSPTTARPSPPDSTRVGVTFPAHPFGPHPWRAHAAWGSSIVLHLSRADTAYGVWKFFDLEGQFRHWYVNFEPPCVRVPGGYEAGDHGLDLIVHPDGRREWKDVEDLHHQRAQGRISADTVGEVLAAAAEVVDLLDRDDRWWAGMGRLDSLIPPQASTPPPVTRAAARTRDSRCRSGAPALGERRAAPRRTPACPPASRSATGVEAEVGEVVRRRAHVEDPDVAGQLEAVGDQLATAPSGVSRKACL